jgi:tetratricopeptide (TPR) repeat protein
MRANFLSKAWHGYVLIFVFAFILYGNSIMNHYSMDDNMVVFKNESIKKGFKAIPGIFKSRYTEDNKQSYEYRPVVKSTFAIEYQFFGESPHISHFFNVLIYALACMLLLMVMKRLLQGYHPWLPLFIALLFAAHPLHTEVVASLKNRDEILSWLGSLLTLWFVVKYADTKKLWYLPAAFFSFIFAYWSKSGALAFVAVIPLVLYFFTAAGWKKILAASLVIIAALFIARVLPRFYLPHNERVIQYFENPLYFHKGFWVHIGTSLIVLLYYLRLLVLPHPLMFYYGFNEVPVAGIGNYWAILSLALNLALFIVAVYYFRKKTLLSFAILYYFITVSMYANLIKPPPGMVAERFLFSPSLGFCILVMIGLFAIFKEPLKTVSMRLKPGVVVILGVLLLLYAGKTISRNPDWNNELSLYSHDIEYASQSAKANSMLASVYMVEVYRAPNAAKMKEMATNAIKYFRAAVTIYPKYATAWNNMGSMYFKVMQDYTNSVECFKKAIEADTNYTDAIFNLGYNMDVMNKLPQAEVLYSRALLTDPKNVNVLSNLANLYFKMKQTSKALDLNQRIISIDPASDVPYVNIGNYYFITADTVSAINYWEKAIDKKPNNRKLCDNLSRYFAYKGNQQKSSYYRNLANNASR